MGAWGTLKPSLVTMLSVNYGNCVLPCSCHSHGKPGVASSMLWGNPWLPIVVTRSTGKWKKSSWEHWEALSGSTGKDASVAGLNKTTQATASTVSCEFPGPLARSWASLSLLSLRPGDSANHRAQDGHIWPFGRTALRESRKERPTQHTNQPLAQP